jgi:hypothetical protein
MAVGVVLRSSGVDELLVEEPLDCSAACPRVV